jgi:hypothetical protein
MDAEELRSAHRARPFRPITIRTTTGETYLVANPEVMWQTENGETVIIGTGGEHFTMLDLDQIASFDVSEAGPTDLSRLREFRSRRPIRPFAIRTDSGETHVVRDPEQMLIDAEGGFVILAEGGRMVVIEIARIVVVDET